MGVFRFKKFSVCDDGATMKIGTDAVLLGSWCGVGNAVSILDIGSGSGILSLMMAQRTNPNARIDAVEPLTSDAEQSVENILNSPWPNKIKVVNINIQAFLSETRYDLIICNPPFFSNSLLPPAETRRKVRHDGTLPFAELTASAIRLLAPKGKLCLILPARESEIFVEKAKAQKLYLNRLTRFYTRKGKHQERSLMELTFHIDSLVEDSLILYQSKDQWADEYQRLTSEFYLDR